MQSLTESEMHRRAADTLQAIGQNEMDDDCPGEIDALIRWRREREDMLLLMLKIVGVIKTSPLGWGSQKVRKQRDEGEIKV